MTVNETTFRVRYAETDQMGMTHHSSYIPWFEVGRTEYMRERDFPYTQLERMGIGLPLIELHCRYFRTTRYDDLVTVRTTLRELTRSRLGFDYEVWVAPPDETGTSSEPGIAAGPQKVAEGYTIHVFTSLEGKPIHLSRQSELWQRLSSLSVEVASPSSLAPETG